MYKIVIEERKGNYCNKCGQVHIESLCESKVINVIKKEKEHKKSFGKYFCGNIAFGNYIKQGDSGGFASTFIRCKNWGCPMCRLIMAKGWLMRLANEDFNYRKCSILCLTTPYVEVTEYDMAEAFEYFWYNLKVFCKKLGYNDISYFYVLEYTENGRLHIHCILRDVPMIPNKWISEHWSLGIITWISAFREKKGKNIPAYLFKYFIKSDEQLKRDRNFDLCRKVHYSRNFFKRKIKQEKEECDHDFKEFDSYYVKRSFKRKLKDKNNQDCR